MATPAKNKRTSGRTEEVLGVAARLFRNRGYDGTSMQEIANEVGILKGSLYHYVETKEDLLWMIVERPLTELVERAEDIFADTSVPITERLGLAIDAHCASFERHHPHMFVITRENGETLSPRRRADLLALRDRYYQLFKQAIANGVRSGELRADLDVALTVQAIFGTVNWMFRWFTPGGRVTAAEVADQFADLIVAGAAPPPSSSAA